MYLYIRESYGVCLRSGAFRREAPNSGFGVVDPDCDMLVYWVSMLMLVLPLLFERFWLSVHYFEDAVAIAVVGGGGGGGPHC